MARPCRTPTSALDQQQCQEERATDRCTVCGWEIRDHALTTHWEGCEEDHHGCALAKLREVTEERDRLKDTKLAAALAADASHLLRAVEAERDDAMADAARMEVALRSALGLIPWSDRNALGRVVMEALCEHCRRGCSWSGAFGFAHICEHDGPASRPPCAAYGPPKYQAGER